MVCIISFMNISTSYANIIENFNFKNITIEDGLSQSTVKTIYQDIKGYIWVGTDAGLNRYNGYEFKQYKHDEYNKNSISHNYIIDITEDTVIVEFGNNKNCRIPMQKSAITQVERPE